MTLETDDMDLAGDIVQSLATYMGIEVNLLIVCVLSLETHSPCLANLCNDAHPHPYPHAFRICHRKLSFLVRCLI